MCRAERTTNENHQFSFAFAFALEATKHVYAIMYAKTNIAVHTLVVCLFSSLLQFKTIWISQFIQLHWLHLSEHQCKRDEKHALVTLECKKRLPCVFHDRAIHFKCIIFQFGMMSDGAHSTIKRDEIHLTNISANVWLKIHFHKSVLTSLNLLWQLHRKHFKIPQRIVIACLKNAL